MNEEEPLIDLNNKNVCCTCLRMDNNVSAMSPSEIITYRNILQKIPSGNSYLHICIYCKWMLRKLSQFIQQCFKAEELLTQAVTSDTIPFLPLTLSHSFTTSVQSCSVTEESEGLCNETVYSTDEYDDDEVPLVVFKKERDEERRETGEEKEEKPAEIKQEDLTNEFNIPLKPCKKSKRRKKELKSGFTSRMVQETEEYEVIKLTKEQVLQEMNDKSKELSYVKAPYKCVKCIKGFNFEDVLRNHMEKHCSENGVFQCDMCFQYCPSAVSLRGHVKSHTTRYKCKVCGTVRLSRQHLLEHHAIAHTGQPTKYSCDTCSYTTNKRTVIQRHVRSHSAVQQHPCHECGKLFKSIDSLRVHAMRHDKSRCYDCDKCDKSFSYPCLLRKHVISVHEGEDHYCVECDIKFKSFESLKLHFKRAKRHRDTTAYNTPTPSSTELLPFIWPTVTKETRPYLSLDTELTIKSRPFNKRFAFWDLFYKLNERYQVGFGYEPQYGDDGGDEGIDDGNDGASIRGSFVNLCIVLCVIYFVYM